jgi:DNA-binding response OmpR family regulator
VRILIAEDDVNLVNFLKRGLTEEFYAVDACHDGEEAVFLADINEYDIIILDIMLPKKNGIAVCRELRENSNITPIIFLTAKDQLTDKIRGLREGADDYLTKPFAFDELLVRIQALLRRSQRYKSNSLQVGTLQLDPVSRKVTREGNLITLTAKEYSLLEYLMRNKGDIITQAKIIEHVWDMNYDGLSNIVNVYIKHLRDKIDKGYPQNYIHTIRGAGYKIDEDL